MAVAFKEDTKQFNLKVCHYYILIDMNEKFVKICHVKIHGRTCRFKCQKLFFYYLFFFELSYSEKKKIYVTRSENLGRVLGKLQKSTKLLMCVIYDLLIEENVTQQLINLLEE